jgi:hypothetical protein
LDEADRDRMDYLTNVLGLDKKEAAALLAR